MRYVIDGTDQYGNYAGDATRPPFVVFDIEGQRNVAGPFRFRWLAVIALALTKWTGALA